MRRYTPRDARVSTANLYPRAERQLWRSHPHNLKVVAGKQPKLAYWRICTRGIISLIKLWAILVNSGQWMRKKDLQL